MDAEPSALISYRDAPPDAGVYGGPIFNHDGKWIEQVPEKEGGGFILWRQEFNLDGEKKWAPFEHLPAKGTQA